MAEDWEWILGKSIIYSYIFGKKILIELDCEENLKLHIQCLLINWRKRVKLRALSILDSAVHRFSVEN